MQGHSRRYIDLRRKKNRKAKMNQGHPMDLFLRISVLQANFYWLKYFHTKRSKTCSRTVVTKCGICPTTRARKASENNRARKCTRQNVSRSRTCEPVCRLRGSRSCNYSRTRIKRHLIKRSVFKVPKISSLDVL